MFSGGVFIFKPDSDEKFICSDGIEMNQKDLLNIVLGVKSLLQITPLEPHSRKVIFVEAASTLIWNTRGNIFGISTYHALSIPLLSSLMERVINIVSTIYAASRDDIDISSYKERSMLFYSIRQLLTNFAGAPINKQIIQSMNKINDTTMNAAIFYTMEPNAQGEFKPTGDAPQDIREDSTTEASTAEGTNPDAPTQLSATQSMKFDSSTFISGFNVSSDILKLSSSQFKIQENTRGIVNAKFSQEATFTVQNKAIQEFNCQTKCQLLCGGFPSSGDLIFAIIPASGMHNCKVNRKLIEEVPNSRGVFKSSNPIESFNEAQLVLVFDTTGSNIAVPFAFLTDFEESENEVKIHLIFASKYPFTELYVAGNIEGITEIKPQQGVDAKLNGNSLLVQLTPPEKKEERKMERFEYVLTAIKGGNFTKPEKMNVKCQLTDVSLCPFDIKPHPDYKFDKGYVERKLSVTNSIWIL